MEAAQPSQLELLAELPEKNPGPVARLDRDARVLMANAAARAFLGREPSSEAFLHKLGIG